MTETKANWLLVSVSLVWGLSYIFMKWGLVSLPLLFVVALRCGIAFLILVAIFHRQLWPMNRRTLIAGAIAGALLCGVFLGLLYGVKYTSASEAAFLTNTTVVIVPLIQFGITRQAPSRIQLVSLGIVLAGLVALTGGFSHVNIGSLWCLISATLYAVHIIVSNRFVRSVRPIQLGVLQLGFASLFALIGSMLLGQIELPHTVVQWTSILGLSLLCSAYGFTVQAFAQRYTSATNVGMFFSLEPVFSAILARLLLQEMMTPVAYLGALLILIGIYLKPVTVWWRQRATVSVKLHR
ncbi:DMT family transporter [Secundilactobacillus muriivasis]